MDTQFFILSAYCLTGVLLGSLCLATWLRARHVRKELADRARHEA